MSLADQIIQLMGRTLEELDELDLYVTRTQQVWRFVRELSTDPAWPGARLRRTGNTSVLLPVDGGSDDPQYDLKWIAARANEYTAGYLAEAAFQQPLAVFEAFFADLLTTWLTAYPDSLRKRQFDFGLVLDATDRDAAIGQVISTEVGGLLYKPLAEQFAYLASRVGISPPPPEKMSQLAEAKATRNVLVHNRGIINSHYTTLAGDNARYRAGQRVEVPEPYRRQVWELIRQLVIELSEATLAKLAPDLPPAPPTG